MNSLIHSKETRMDSLAPKKVELSLFVSLTQYDFCFFEKNWNENFLLIFLGTSKVQKKGRKKMSVNPFYKLKKSEKLNCIYLYDPWFRDCQLSGYYRGQANIEISAVGSWEHCLPSSKGITSSFLLIECGLFCRIVCLFLFFLKGS